MSKVRNFFASLNKSTKITLISCGCFVALTVVILGFFVLFPISPSETIQQKYGREAKASKSTESAQTVTTQPANDESFVGSKGTAVSGIVTTTRMTRKKNFSVTVTTGDGFYSGGRIHTGGDPNENNYPPDEPTDPIDYPIPPEPTDYPPYPTEYPTDVPQPPTDIPPVTDPPPATDPPPTDPPPATDPPPTDAPPEAQNW